MTIRFAAKALEELAQAWEWYENASPGLGEAFYDEIERTVAHILSYPYAFPEKSNGFRCVLIHRFPFALWYGVNDMNITVLAVANTHRKPDYWLDRIPE